MIVNEELFSFINNRYNSKDGNYIIRYGILVNEETEESIVEIYFKEFRFYPVPSTNFKLD